jgi:hypothetical protein
MVPGCVEVRRLRNHSEHLPTQHCLPCTLHCCMFAPLRYAEKVSQGYRPACPKRMPPGAWSLIEACWQQQPGQRPAMASVVARLQQLMEQEQAGSVSRRSSFSFAGPALSRRSSASGGARSGGCDANEHDPDTTAAQVTAKAAGADEVKTGVQQAPAIVEAAYDGPAKAVLVSSVDAC